MKFLRLSLLVLGLGLGTSAARAANAYAGTYTMLYADHEANGKAQYGTLKIATNGAITITLTTYVGSGFNKQNVITGTVSSTGVVKANNPSTAVTFKFVKQGSAVVGFTGTTGVGGVLVGVRKA